MAWSENELKGIGLKSWVYIIYSCKLDRYYKGVSANPVLRTSYHNRGDTKSTKHTGDWVLVFSQSFNTKTEALKFERRLKRSKSIKTVRRCIADSRNQVHELLSGDRENRVGE